MQHDVQTANDGLAPELAARLVRIEDPAAEAFEHDCVRRPHGRARMWARGALGRFVSDYDANGLLGTHDMHLLGTDAWRSLLARGGWVPPGDARLLDVGAGDGRVTAPLAELFTEVVTTELSAPMRRRLERRGWRCHAVDLAQQGLPEPGPFHAVALLNVLDRTDRPLTLLARSRNLARQDGCVLLASPFPLRPHVHVGPATVDPDEPLPQRASSWEESVTVFVRDTLEPVGLEVRVLARVPYLCRGPRRQPVLSHDDAILVCTPT